MLKLLKASNAAAGEFGQPPLYATTETQADYEKTNQKPRAKRVRLGGGDFRDGLAAKAEVDKEDEEMVGAFHFSIGWTLKAPDERTVERLKDVTAASKGFDIRVENVKVKMGNGVSVIPLTEKRDSSNGIIEI